VVRVETVARLEQVEAHLVQRAMADGRALALGRRVAGGEELSGVTGAGRVTDLDTARRLERLEEQQDILRTET
jgi:hypothetical protein